VGGLDQESRGDTKSLRGSLPRSARALPTEPRVSAMSLFQRVSSVLLR
jgi:hypothetical protein